MRQLLAITSLFVCHVANAAIVTDFVQLDVDIPFESENATLYTVGPPSTKLWSPTVTGIEGFVTYKFDVTTQFDYAEIFMPIHAFIGIDKSAYTILEVSVDNENWNHVAHQSFSNATNDGVTGPWNISQHVLGFDEIYVKARMYRLNGAVQSAQFLRQGGPFNHAYLRVIPEPSYVTMILTLLICSTVFSMWRN